MLNKKLKTLPESKLAKTLSRLSENEQLEKTGLIQSSTKSFLYKTKSFRLREEDLISLTNIVSHVNSRSTRQVYSDSQVIRGLINYLSDNVDSNINKILPYIKSSS